MLEHVGIVRTSGSDQVKMTSLRVAAIASRSVGPRLHSALCPRVVVLLPIEVVVIIPPVVVDHPIIGTVDL